MAKLKNHTSHNQSYNAHKNGIKKPWQHRHTSTKGGVLRVNQLIEVRHGIVMKDESGNIKCTPIYSRIVSLYAEQNELQFAVPGGLIGVGTTMDLRLLV